MYDWAISYIQQRRSNLLPDRFLNRTYITGTDKGYNLREYLGAITEKYWDVLFEMSLEDMPLMVFLEGDPDIDSWSLSLIYAVIRVIAAWRLSIGK